MQRSRSVSRGSHKSLSLLTILIMTSIVSAAVAHAQGPMSVKVEISDLQSYTGTPLQKPTKILVYDFVVNSKGVQVDQSQRIRPRHLIFGDQKPDSVGKDAISSFSNELVKKLAKTGIPVEHVAADVVPTDTTLVVQGSFLSLRQGDKTERVTIGMGTGSAEVQSKVDVRLKTASDAIQVAQFQTDTKPGANMGAGVPVAAGLNPAAVAAKSTVGDRKKNVDTYVSKTADATAEQIVKSMTQQGWIKATGKAE